MSCYEALAGSYDALTEDVGYAKRADFLEKLLRRSRIPVKLVLDLACGTGTMTWLLTARGYEVIGVDGSEDMLAGNAVPFLLACAGWLAVVFVIAGVVLEKRDVKA